MSLFLSGPHGLLGLSGTSLSRIYHPAHFHVDDASIGNVASVQTTKMGQCECRSLQNGIDCLKTVPNTDLLPQNAYPDHDIDEEDVVTDYLDDSVVQSVINGVRIIRIVSRSDIAIYI